jgi:ribonuclease HI
MTHPTPCPPAHTVQSAFDAVASRSGVTVRVQHRRGMIFWAVARTVGGEVGAVHSGLMAARDAGPRLGLLQDRLDRVVRQVRATADESVYCCEPAHGLYDVSDALTARGHAVSEQYPPTMGLDVTAVGVEDAMRSFYRRMVVSTDASAGRQGWTGTGWIIDFGQGSLPRLGAVARRGGTILEAELRAILLGLHDAARLIPNGLAGECGIVVRSDSKWALRMVTEPGWSPPRTSKAALDVVPLIHTATRGLRVDFAWVKGHSGDAGNEVADRLAVMSRRHAEMDLPAEICQQNIDALRREIAEWDAQKAHSLAA